MITLKQLKKYLEGIPDTSMVYAHEKLDAGIVIINAATMEEADTMWFIPASRLPTEEAMFIIKVKPKGER